MQRNGKGVGSAVLVVLAFAVWPVLKGQSAPAQRPAPTAAGRGGRGGGGMRASQTLFEQQCSGCHGGADGSTGRAPNLFDGKWLNSVSDDQIQKAVRAGIPNTEMGGFSASQLNDQQLFELVAFLRTTSGNLAPKVEFVADPDGKVIRSEKQTFKIEVLARDIDGDAA